MKPFHHHNTAPNTANHIDGPKIPSTVDPNPTPLMKTRPVHNPYAKQKPPVHNPYAKNHPPSTAAQPTPNTTGTNTPKSISSISAASENSAYKPRTLYPAAAKQVSFMQLYRICNYVVRIRVVYAMVLFCIFALYMQSRRSLTRLHLLGGSAPFLGSSGSSNRLTMPSFAYTGGQQ